MIKLDINAQMKKLVKRE